MSGIDRQRDEPAARNANERAASHARVRDDQPTAAEAELNRKLAERLVADARALRESTNHPKFLVGLILLQAVLYTMGFLASRGGNGEGLAWAISGVLSVAASSEAFRRGLRGSLSLSQGLTLIASAYAGGALAFVLILGPAGLVRLLTNIHLFSAPLVFMVILVVSITSRDRPPQCARCRYMFDETGVVQRCPECGSDWTRPGSVVVGAASGHWPWAIAALGILGAMLPLAPIGLNSVIGYTRLPQPVVRAAALARDSNSGAAVKKLIARGVTATTDPELVDQLLDWRLAPDPRYPREAGEFLHTEVMARRLSAAQTTKYFRELHEPGLYIRSLGGAEGRHLAIVGFVPRGTFGTSFQIGAAVESITVAPPEAEGESWLIGRSLNVFEARWRYPFRADGGSSHMPEDLPSCPRMALTLPQRVPVRVRAHVVVWIENGRGGVATPATVDDLGRIVSPATAAHVERFELEQVIPAGSTTPQ